VVRAKDVAEVMRSRNFSEFFTCHEDGSFFTDTLSLCDLEVHRTGGGHRAERCRHLPVDQRRDHVRAAAPPVHARYDGPADGYDFGQDIAIDPDGDLFITGYSDGVDSGPDHATISYDGTGQRRWIKRYDGPAHDSDTARALAVAPDGCVYVTGWSFGTDSIDFPFDIVTIAYDGTSGHRVWVRRYNGPSNGSDGGNDVVVAPDGSAVYATGFSDRAGAGSNFDYLTASIAT
jgi:Beta-propeller repeat